MFDKKTIITSSLVICLAFGALLHPSFSAAQSINELRSQSAQLEQQINANNQRAKQLDAEGDTLRSAVASLDLQIQQTTAQIQLTDNKIKQLTQELKTAEDELARQKELLKANMRALYKRGDASTVEMIVGSDNFSQFIDEQEYLERLKSGIQESTEKILALTKQIEAQKLEQEELKKQQESARQSLSTTRQQRANLLAQTEGQEAKYRSVVADLEAKRAAVEQALTARLLAGSYVNHGPISAGQLVGRVGMTGFTFGPHLHFELRNSSLVPLNPGGFPLGYGLTWPVPSNTSIIQGYGCVSESYYYSKCAGGGSLHAGLDIPASTGTPIVAAKSGIIIHRGNDGDGYGNKVIIKHSDGTYTYYAHMQ